MGKVAKQRSRKSGDLNKYLIDLLKIIAIKIFQREKLKMKGRKIRK